LASARQTAAHKERGSITKMRSATLGVSDKRSFALVFSTGDEVVSGLIDFFKGNNLRSCFFQGVGACRHVTLGFFDLGKKDYVKTAIDEQVEVMSLIGNVTLYNGEPKVHGHIVVGKHDSTAHGGHLIEGVVRPTLELLILESPTGLIRTIDAETRLPLIDLQNE
jgi:Predicted DNA-binding protein with PD1-like DNA-binding motif